MPVHRDRAVGRDADRDRGTDPAGHPLAAVPLFAMLGPDRLRRIADRSVPRQAAPGAVLALRGEPARYAIVVQTGVLTAVRDTADGRRLRLGEFPAPCVVDKTALLDGGGYTATWVAATRTRYRLLPAVELLALIDDLPALRRHVLSHLAGQVRDREVELAHAYTADGMTRIAGWLVSATARFGRRIPLPGGQQALGESVGLTRVSVNRALQTLARAGLIRVERSAVTVLAPELLAARAVPEMSVGRAEAEPVAPGDAGRPVSWRADRRASGTTDR